MARPRASLSAGFSASRSEDRSAIGHRSIGTGLTGMVRHRPLPRQPITRDQACTVPPFGRRVGNDLGTGLATSAPYGHNVKTPRWRRASLGFADFRAIHAWVVGARADAKAPPDPGVMKSSSCTSLVFIRIPLRCPPLEKGGQGGITAEPQPVSRFRDGCPPRTCRIGPTYWPCLLPPPAPPFSSYCSEIRLCPIRNAGRDLGSANSAFHLV